jgi:hypothetical protein
MTEADEIAASMIAKHGNPGAASFDDALDWVLEVWPDAREWVGGQMLDNIAEAVARAEP